MNADELRKHFPRATDDFVAADADDGTAGPTGVQRRSRRPAPKLERNLGDGAMGAVQVQAGLGGRFLVRVKAYRCRLLDEDNLCEKYHVDLCRYAGILSSDAPGTAKIEVSQEKVGSKEREFVLIEIYRIKETPVLIMAAQATNPETSGTTPADPPEP